jgi:hypothetical protein
MVTRASRLFTMPLLVLLVGCSPGPSNTDDASRLEEAAGLVIEAVDRTLGEWESAAAAALDGGTPQVPAGIAVVVIGAGAVTRSEGLALPFAPTTPVAERPARESLTPDGRANFPIAEVIGDGWPAWQKTARGRAAEARGQSGVAAAWRTAGDRIAIAAGPIALLSKAAAPRLEALRVRAGIEDPARAVSTTPAAGSIVRTLDAAGLPWVVRLTALK